MKESSYGSEMTSKLIKVVGGQVKKISDKSTLGLPDYMHYSNGLITFIEVKIDDRYEESKGKFFVYPWKRIKSDIRQFEVCRNMSKESLVLYSIYYYPIKMSVVLEVNELNLFRAKDNMPYGLQLDEGFCFSKGHGIYAIAQYMENRRKTIYEQLTIRYRTDG